jgi:hypothetical protein
LILLGHATVGAYCVFGTLAKTITSNLLTTNRCTRIAPRFRIAKPARIEYDREKIDFVVRDLSATGSVNEAPDEFGSFWECAVEAPVEQKQTQHMSPTF